VYYSSCNSWEVSNWNSKGNAHDRVWRKAYVYLIHYPFRRAELTSIAYFDPASEGREHREERLAEQSQTTNGTDPVNGKHQTDTVNGS
jgi:hypothetical protein